MPDNNYRGYNVESLATGSCPVCLEKEGHSKNCAIKGWSEDDRRTAIKKYIDRVYKD